MIAPIDRDENIGSRFRARVQSEENAIKGHLLSRHPADEKGPLLRRWNKSAEKGCFHRPS